MTVTLLGSDWFDANTGLVVSPSGGGVLVVETVNLSESDVGTHGAFGGSGATWGSVAQTKPSAAHAQAAAVSTSYSSGTNAVTVTPNWSGPQVVGIAVWEVTGVTAPPATPVVANGASTPATVSIPAGAEACVTMASNYASDQSPATHDWSGSGYTEDLTDSTEDISGATVAIMSGAYDESSPGNPSAALTGTFTSWCIIAVPFAEPPPIDVVSSAGAALSTNDPSVTFSGYTPLEDDVVALFISSTTVLGVVANSSLPSGWVNPLGDGVEVNSDAHGMACLYHLVTAAEETAGTTTYTATDSLDAAETGYVHGVVVRGVDPSNVIDGINTAFNSGNTTTPHVLAGITGSGVLLDGSLVISSVAKDGTGAYSSTPSGWSQLQATNTNQGRWTGRRDAVTTVDTDVSATNITPSAGDEYCSITIAFAVAPSENNNPDAQAASATATAYNAQGDVKPNAAAAEATAQAGNAQASVAVTAANASVTASADNTQADVKTNAVNAGATATAYDATVSTGGAPDTADAENAPATATSYNAQGSVQTSAGNAPATATAYDAPVDVKLNAVSASATATAYNGQGDVKPSAAAASATATAYNPTVSTTGLFVELWDRTPSDDLGPNWIEAQGDFSIVSGGAVQKDDGGTPPGFCVINKLFTADHWIEAYLHTSDGSGNIGLFCRLSNDGLTGWSFEVADGQYAQINAIDGEAAGTEQTGASHTHATGEVYLVTAEGNELRFYRNGVLVLSDTTTTYNTNQRTGLHWHENAAGDVLWGWVRSGPMPYVPLNEPDAQNASATATAYNPQGSVASPAGNASAAAAAGNVQGSVAVAPSTASGTAAAGNTQGDVRPSAVAASATATAYDPTISAGGAGQASAQVAPASPVAYNAQGDIRPNAQNASASAQADNATVTRTGNAPAGTADAVAVAAGASASVQASAVSAGASAVANNAVGAGTGVGNAQVATALVTAYVPGAMAVATTGVTALANAVAYNGDPDISTELSDISVTTPGRLGEVVGTRRGFTKPASGGQFQEEIGG